MITPRTLKGFRDFLPEQMIARDKLLEIAADVYRSYGFVPIDTPALEYLEILSGKGSDETDKQLYKFQDHGGRDVALRFDLTVPLARFSAQHINELGTPFKRYQFGKVWRGENTQAGRYREFTQCDFDTIGTRSIVADIETALVIHDLLQRIDIKTNVPFENFTIHINNRKVLTGMLEKQGLVEKTVQVLRALDKLAKIGEAKVVNEMTETAGTNAEQAKNVLQLASIKGESKQIIEQLRTLLKGNETGETGAEELETICNALKAAGVPDSRTVIDLSIARGLDYYTGTIFETFLNGLPSIGSVCSGGRYDNLAELYTNQQLPGIGASLGIDRLLAAMEELKMLPKSQTTAKVFIPNFAPNRVNDYLRIITQLRKSGVAADFYPEQKKLGNQLKYADKKGFPYAIIIGEEEFEKQTAQIKNLVTGENKEVKQDEITSELFG
ncbi:MAG: histidine--tRNA ligase [Planctomycetaceae bacterium]|jgi:histidyl-tRNA synthetase|nr:histidine--tRNA ligase [Planctomycetaceae bacterium]